MDASQAISSWYRKETYLKTYSHFIQPVPNMKMWPKRRNPIVEPPEVRKMSGMPPKNRRREIGEVRNAGKLPRMETVMTCIVLSSPTNKSYSFFHPTVEAVAQRFLNRNIELSDTTKFVATCVRNNVNEIEDKLAEFKIREDVASKETIILDQAKEMREIGCWEDIEKLKTDELTQFEAWLNVAYFNMKYRLKQLENEVASNTS
ncbi:uncharacterized protein LOC125812673 [Solanum verrucosum]|uniref:uncharacterized protein LOC125812673 n=1 Tax=Solanum verrucosum TaxID=315347 RepID=UPI0020D18DFA|nr:uncharacterized protein LOC125812673 [Solanum verrucosum]